MRRLVPWLSLVILLSAALPAADWDSAKHTPHTLPDAKQVVPYLLDISVTLRAGGSEGSGVSFNRDGVSFIWSAGHVVDGLRRQREVVDGKTGTTRTVIEFQPATVVQTLIEDGRKVGTIEMEAEVVRYSGIEHGEDLALLKVRKKNFMTTSAVFYQDKELPAMGTRLYHVGSLLGNFGANSLTDGIMSQHGRVINNKEFDQTTVVAFPGSSGAGVYLQDGRYIGMLVRGATGGFNLIVPMRRMRAWAKQANVEWALDPKVPLPTAEEFKKLPVEDSGTSFDTSKASHSPRERAKQLGLLIQLTAPVTSPLDAP